MTNSSLVRKAHEAIEAIFGHEPTHVGNLEADRQAAHAAIDALAASGSPLSQSAREKVREALKLVQPGLGLTATFTEVCQAANLLESALTEPEQLTQGFHDVAEFYKEEPEQPRCDHKFVDSNHCIKCGWFPGGTYEREPEQGMPREPSDHPGWCACHGEFTCRLCETGEGWKERR